MATGVKQTCTDAIQRYADEYFAETKKQTATAKEIAVWMKFLVPQGFRNAERSGIDQLAFTRSFEFRQVAGGASDVFTEFMPFAFGRRCQDSTQRHRGGHGEFRGVGAFAHGEGGEHAGHVEAGLGRK